GFPVQLPIVIQDMYAVSRQLQVDLGPFEAVLDRALQREPRVLRRLSRRAPMRHYLKRAGWPDRLEQRKHLCADGQKATEQEDEQDEISVHFSFSIGPVVTLFLTSPKWNGATALGILFSG